MSNLFMNLNRKTIFNIVLIVLSIIFLTSYCANVQVRSFINELLKIPSIASFLGAIIAVWGSVWVADIKKKQEEEKEKFNINVNTKMVARLLLICFEQALVRLYKLRKVILVREYNVASPLPERFHIGDSGLLMPLTYELPSANYSVEIIKILNVDELAAYFDFINLCKCTDEQLVKYYNFKDVLSTSFANKLFPNDETPPLNDSFIDYQFAQSTAALQQIRNIIVFNYPVGSQAIHRNCDMNHALKKLFDKAQFEAGEISNYTFDDYMQKFDHEFVLVVPSYSGDKYLSTPPVIDKKES